MGKCHVYARRKTISTRYRKTSCSTLPDGTIPPGWLSEFFARRAALIHQQDTDELALELSGDSSLHLMIFRDMDPKEKRRRKEEEDRRRLLAEQELQEYRERSDRLLARIEQQQVAVEKHRQGDRGQRAQAA